MPLSGCAIPKCTWTYSKNKRAEEKRAIFQVNEPNEKMSDEKRADCEMLCGYIKNLRGHGILITESLKKGK